jgi:hypothetical protein
MQTTITWYRPSERTPRQCQRVLFATANTVHYSRLQTLYARGCIGMVLGSWAIWHIARCGGRRYRKRQRMTSAPADHLCPSPSLHRDRRGRGACVAVRGEDGDISRFGCEYCTVT